MHVEIENRDALEGMGGQRVGSADGDIVEQAESHGLVALGMVPGRANGAKRVVDCAARNEVHGRNDGPRGAARGVERTGPDHGIGIEPMQAARRYARVDRIDVGGVMNA